MLRRIVLLAVCLAVSVVFGSASAFAGSTHVFASSFGSAGAEAGQVSLAGDSGVAVNTATHDVYVADTGNARVDEFSSGGAFLRAWGWGVADGLPELEVCTLVCQAGIQGSGAGQFTTPAFVAVDNSAGASAGDVYVGDRGTNTVLKFSEAGAYVSTNTGSGATSPVAGPFGSLAGVAVDGSGNAWVYDESGNMFEFAQDGSFLTDWYSGRGVTANGIDLDSAGNPYVLTGGGSVEQFTPSGTDVGPVNGDAFSPTGFAVDRSNNDVFMDNGGGAIRHYPAACDAGGNCPAQDVFAEGQLNGGAGVAVDSESHTVYAADAGNARIAAFAAVTLPDVATGEASGATQSTATLNGTVNAQGTAISDCHFDYATEAEYKPGEPNPYAAGASAPCASIPSGSSPVSVSASVTGLTAGSVYHFRLSVTSPGGAVTGSDETFSTGPSIDSTYAVEVNSTAAGLRAQINPHGLATTYHFEYGASAAYGQSTAESASLGADNQDHTAGARIQGLEPGAVYHYRVVATNATAPSGIDGPDGTFATQPAGGAAPTLPDNRGYELVTPAVKGDGSFLMPGGGGGLPSFQAAVSGDGMTFSTRTPLPDATTGGNDAYLSARGPDGWSSRDLFPPQTISTVVGGSLAASAFSPDLSKMAFVDGGSTSDSPPLVSGEPERGTNLFLRDNATNIYQLMDVTPAGVTPGGSGFEGASADFSRILFGSDAELVPGALTHPRVNLYEWSGGSVSIAGLIPVAPATRCGAGGPACVISAEGASLGGGEGLDTHNGLLNAVSPDGSNVFFTDADVFATVFGLPQQLYVRENGETTVEYSASQKTNGSGPGGTDPAGTHIPEYWPASPDGSKAFFTSCEQLTNDSTASSAQSGGHCHGENMGSSLVGNDLYQYDTASGVLTDLTVDHSGDPVGADVQAVYGASSDGSYVYFVANGVLAAGASPGDCHQIVNGVKGHCNLYVTHNGTVTFIARIADDASIQSGSAGNWEEYATTARVTPDGTHLAFETTASVTGYDNQIADGSSSCGVNPLETTTASGDPHCSEVYLYDALSHELRCASCNPTGARPLGASYLPDITELGGRGALSGHGDQYLPRSLSADGSRLFFDSEDALAPGDVNARMDVYEYENGRAYLISSGTSSENSAFADASASGSDVFFLTRSQLVGQDSDQAVDLYDARVGGGFPFLAPPAPCSGEACKAPPAPPAAESSLSSGAVGGAGNLANPPAVTGSANTKPKAKAKPARCGKGRVRKRGKCVKKRGKKASQTRRAARGGK